MANTSIVTIDDMKPADLRLMHLEVKNRGRGAMSEFIQHETPYTKSQYYYRMRQKGVMPFKGQSDKNVLEFKGKGGVPANQSRIEQLEFELEQIKQLFNKMSVTPAERAIGLLSKVGTELDDLSRKFLGGVIAKDYATLSPKKQKWMSDLEARYLK